MKYLVSLFKVKKLSKREKILFIMLINIILLWACNEYILSPQREALETLSNKKLKLDIEIEELNNILKGEESIVEEIVSMNSSIIKLGNSYFPNLDQTQLIYYVEDIFIRNSIKLLNMDFSEIENLVLVDDLEAQYIDINIPYEGKYEDVVQALKDIKNGSLKVIIKSLYLTNIQDEYLKGEVTLRFFSLGNMINLPLNELNLRPGEHGVEYIDLDLFSEEVGGQNEEETVIEAKSEVVVNEAYKIDNSIETIGEESIKKEVIYNFKDGEYNFSSSNDYIKGQTEIFRDNKDTFLRWELYMKENTLEENRAYINIKNKPIIFNKPKSRLYLNTKSYNYSSGILGIRLKTYSGQIIDLMISEEIQWLGWKDIIFSLPNNLAYYPLELTDIYYETENKYDEINVLLFNKLEAEIINDSDTISDFYIVEVNDTITSISTKIYGSDKYVKEIMRNNNLSSSENLEPGKILILKRR